MTNSSAFQPLNTNAALSLGRILTVPELSFPFRELLKILFLLFQKLSKAALVLC